MGMLLEEECATNVTNAIKTHTFFGTLDHDFQTMQQNGNTP